MFLLADTFKNIFFLNLNISNIRLLFRFNIYNYRMLYIHCRMRGFQKKCELHSYSKPTTDRLTDEVIYWGATAPKKPFTSQNENGGHVGWFESAIKKTFRNIRNQNKCYENWEFKKKMIKKKMFQIHWKKDEDISE